MFCENNQRLITAKYFTKRSILDAWQSLEYAFVIQKNNLVFFIENLEHVFTCYFCS